MNMINLGTFLIGKYEVTQEEYEALTGQNPSRFRGKRLPVEQVNWYEAVLFCNTLSQKEGLSPAYRIDKNNRDPGNKDSHDLFGWLVEWNRRSDGYRLPVEAEWEYACRAGTKTKFSTGSSIDTTQANFCDYYGDPRKKPPPGKFRKKTTPVDMFPPNPWGICDMHGNVFEWCWDWFDGSVRKNNRFLPPPSGTKRVIRGGSWRWLEDWISSRFRHSFSPCKRYFESVGFRVARSVF
jgi:formylglycine-generating enzyme required for sulfatase activity